MGGERNGATRRARRWRAAIAVAAALLAAGCGTRDFGAVYSSYSDRMIASGFFREETAPTDAPFSDEDLIRNFLKIVFVPEAQLARFYEGRGDSPRRLSKWRGPIRYSFSGDGVLASDQAAVAAIASDLAQSTGLAIGPAGPDETPSLVIFIMSPAARENIADTEQGSTWYRSSILRDWVEQANPPCFAIFDAGDASGGEIRSAAIFLKAEMRDPLRRACLTEELTQSLGLVFDHEDARPSIFNDDQEFIALTDHDRALLRILYDPRLTPGMTEREAAPVVRRIVAARSRS